MADCTLFDEDEICVCSPDKGVIYGLVVENSEYVSSDEYSDGDDAPDRVKRGTVRVSWHPDGKEAVLPEKDLCLADRSLMPGDVVRRLIEGKDSQRGYVIDINSYCHLKVFGTDKFIYNVNTIDLHPLQAIDDEPGDVTLDSWVGKIDSINKSIILRFADDARCEVDDFNLNSFEDVLEKGRRQSEFFMVDCFPGQTLRGEMGELGSAKWIHATNRFNARVCSKRPYKKVTVLVESVSISSVEVHWVCKGFNKVENPLERFEPPPEIVHGENLQRLRALDTHHSSIQLGDRCYYDIKATDVLETKPPSQFPPLHVEKQQVDNWYSLFDKKSDASAKADNKSKAASSEDKSMGDSNVPNKPIPLEKAPSENLSSGNSGMVNGFAAENVSESQEGNPDESIYDDADDESDETCSMSSEESTHSASSLSTKKSKNLRKKNATVTATFKKKKKGKRPKSTLPIHVPVVSTNPGDRVPVDVCYTFSVASVMWQDGTVEKEVSSVDLFPIHHLDELEFFPGDYVVNSKDTGDSNEYGVVVTCDHAERTCLIKHMKAYEVGKASSPTEVKPPGEVSVYDIKDHPYYKFRPGQVVIRVGGFEKSSGPLEAAGLVKETNSDGRITVKWADNVVSPAYPQELYIIGGEMSEAGSDSEWETDSDSEAGEGVTDGSWETEDEEVLDGVDSDEVKKLTAETSAMENGLMVSMAVDRLSELEALLTRSQEALERSDQALGSLDPKEDAGLFGVAAIYLDIVKICKHFDKIWKSTYFSDQTLTTLIDDLKSEIRKGKAQKIVRHLSQVYAAWVEEENNKKEKPQEVTERKDEISNTCSSNTLCKCDSEGASACATKGTEKRCKSEKSTSEPRDSKSHFANARTLCHTIYTMLRDKMKLIQEEVDKVGKQNCGTRSESQVVKKPETANMHSQTDESSLSKQNGTGGDNTEKRPATMENGDSHPENVEMSKATDETFEGAVASTPVNSCGNDGVLETMDNIIQMFVSNLPCLPDSCLSSSGDESSLQARYKEVEETEPSPQGSGAATTNTKDFHICESAPGYHKFRIKSHAPTNPKAFMSAVRKELTLLKTSLPDGIFVKAFEDRMDLFSIMITGPANTPYEDGLFFFDVQLPNDYPKYPPSFHYYSYCDDRLNPNLYEDGKVCVSLLGTWSGKGNEVWTNKSNMLQVLISIQGLILVSEPYYNEAGFEKQRGTQQGLENSKMYNEMAALKLTQSMAGIAKNPPAIFRAEAHNHLQATGHRLIQRLKGWVKQSDASRKSTSAPHVEGERPSSAANGNKGNCDKNGCGPTYFQGNGETVLQRTSSSNPNAEISSIEAKLTPVDNPDCSESPEEFKQPEFPLLPASKGFCMTIHKHINNLSKALENIKTS